MLIKNNYTCHFDTARPSSIPVLIPRLTRAQTLAVVMRANRLSVTHLEAAVRGGAQGACDSWQRPKLQCILETAVGLRHVHPVEHAEKPQTERNMPTLPLFTPRFSSFSASVRSAPSVFFPLLIWPHCLFFFILSLAEKT